MKIQTNSQPKNSNHSSTLHQAFTDLLSKPIQFFCPLDSTKGNKEDSKLKSQPSKNQHQEPYYGTLCTKKSNETNSQPKNSNHSSTLHQAFTDLLSKPIQFFCPLDSTKGNKEDSKLKSQPSKNQHQEPYYGTLCTKKSNETNSQPKNSNPSSTLHQAFTDLLSKPTKIFLKNNPL